MIYAQFYSFHCVTLDCVPCLLQWIKEPGVSTEIGPLPPLPGGSLSDSCYLCGINMAFMVFKLTDVGNTPVAYVCPTCDTARSNDADYAGFTRSKQLIEGGGPLSDLCVLIPALMALLPPGAFKFSFNLNEGSPQIMSYATLGATHVVYSVSEFAQILYDFVDGHVEMPIIDRLLPFWQATSLPEFKKVFTNHYFQITLEQLLSPGKVPSAVLDKFVQNIRTAEQVLRAKFPDTAFLHYGLQKVMIFVCLVAGQGTGIHLDFSPGVNVAFALLQNKRRKITGKPVLACWMFFVPSKQGIEAVQHVMNTGDHFQQYRLSRPPFLDNSGNPIWRGMDAEIREMRCFLDTLSHDDMVYLATTLPEYVFTKEQCDGDIIYFGAGFMHAVVNLEPNYKLAFDRVGLDDLPAMAISHTLFGSRVTAQRNAEDYVCGPKFSMQELYSVMNGLRG